MILTGTLDSTHRKRQRRDGWGTRRSAPEHLRYSKSEFRRNACNPEDKESEDKESEDNESEDKESEDNESEDKESAKSMKRALAILAQFLLFLFVDAAGSIFYHPFHMQTSLSGTALVQRSFIWDGVILMLVLYVLFLSIAALRRRIGTAAPASTVALVLAALAGYLMKFGFITHNW